MRHLLRQQLQIEAGCPALVATVERAMRRLDRLRVERVPVLAFQDAPRLEDRDAEALASGTATRASAIRCWRLAGAGPLGRMLAVNLYTAPPRTLTRAGSVAVVRAESVVATLRDRLGVLVAVGAAQRAPLARVLGITAMPAWNQSMQMGRVELSTVYHPSPRCRAYNPGGPGAAAVPLVHRWLDLRR
ncbi:hypothetical protein ACFQX4_00175 [Roseomonas sp. GCM10028921]